jgi:hypothetical protein
VSDLPQACSGIDAHFFGAVLSGFFAAQESQSAVATRSAAHERSTTTGPISGGNTPRGELFCRF